MIVPAIDIIAGECVRLRQGDYAQQTTYFSDPLEAALQFERAGVEYLHLVDLDGAKLSAPANLDVLRRIKANTSLKVEYGGGIKSLQAVRDVLDAGADRVICGSIAVTSPESFSQWLREFGGEKIVLGADCRDGKVATHGWLRDSDYEVADLIEKFRSDGLKHVIVTDIARDGMLSGPNLSLYTDYIQRFPSVNIIASGGVGCQNDIDMLHALGLKQIIVGKALYEGRVSLC